jgi:exopolyphosphatase/guanosine-5'-triphosphate,3'-diphosphate pyrophosphatase
MDPGTGGKGSVPSAGCRPGMVGVIDIGSNSLRLVLYDQIGRAPKLLFNEKVMCALGRGLNSSGRLNPEGLAPALDNVERFVLLSRQLGVARLDLLATSAVRDAEDGGEFVAEIERRCGVRVSVIDGAREARLSASGVRAGIPEARGITGDLGGGSVELAMTGPEPSDFVASLPIGPLRLIEGSGDDTRPRAIVDQAVASLSWLDRARGQPFYAVGGTWRALARIHMEQTGYPLHVIQNYQVAGSAAQSFFEFISRQSRRSLEKISGISRKRLETVPLAAYVLYRLIHTIEPAELVFSALGLREGHLFELLSPQEQRQDPLLAACRQMAEADPRFAVGGEELVDWSDPLFADETPAQSRLRRAAGVLSDIGWAEHPDYRDEQVFTRCLRMPVPGLDHGGRVFIAVVLQARYGGESEAAVMAAPKRLLDEAEFTRARAIGLAFRLGYTLTGGVPELIGETSLALDAAVVTLTIPEHTAIYTGEAVQRRLDALGRALGRRTVVKVGEPSATAKNRAGRGG